MSGNLKNRRTAWIGMSVIALGIGLLAFSIWRGYGPQKIDPPVSSSAVSETSAVAPPSESAVSSSPPAERIVYPQGKMFVSTQRLHYRDGDLVLRVPRLDLEATALGGFDDETRRKLLDGSLSASERSAFFGNSKGDELLAKGLVLLNSATLPGPDIVNANVSISGHRDVGGCEFYNIHTLVPGDRMYLEYGGLEYVYDYVSTEIHAATDWSITYCKDYSCLTLISCDPIGTSRNRIVVTARLIEIHGATSSDTESERESLAVPL